LRPPPFLVEGRPAAPSEAEARPFLLRLPSCQNHSAAQELPWLEQPATFAL